MCREPFCAAVLPHLASDLAAAKEVRGQLALRLPRRLCRDELQKSLNEMLGEGSRRLYAEAPLRPLC